MTFQILHVFKEKRFWLVTLKNSLDLKEKCPTCWVSKTMLSAKRLQF